MINYNKRYPKHFYQKIYFLIGDVSFNTKCLFYQYILKKHYIFIHKIIINKNYYILFSIEKKKKKKKNYIKKKKKKKKKKSYYYI